MPETKYNRDPKTWTVINTDFGHGVKINGNGDITINGKKLTIDAARCLADALAEAIDAADPDTFGL